MRKSFIAAGLVAAVLAGSFINTSCIGSFNLTNKLLTWNKSIDNKFVNELVFVAFWILPVYEVSGLADLLVLNSIEFWSGNNAVAQGKTYIDQPDGRYLVDCDGKGYTITAPDGVVTRLDFNADTQEWSVLNDNGERVVFLTFVDDTHVKVPGLDGKDRIYSADQAGVFAYQQYAMSNNLARR